MRILNVGCWCVAALLAGALLAEDPPKAKLPFTVSKETTAIVGPLRADGTVDYVAAMNERYGKGVKAEENAFVGWIGAMGESVFPEKTREQMLKLCGAEDVETVGGWHAIGVEGSDAEQVLIKTLWRDEESSVDVSDYLKNHERLLDATKEAFSRPKFWMPAVSEDGRTMITVLIPSLARMRDMGNHLAARAALRAKHGDFEGFLSDVIAVKRMARHMGADWSMISRLVGTATDTVANRAIGAAAGSGKLNAEQCRALSKALSEIGPMAPISDGVDEFERWSILDTAILLAVDDERLANLLSNEYFAQQVKWNSLSKLERDTIDWDALLKTVNAAFDEQIALMKKEPLEAMQRAADALEKTRAKDKRDDEEPRFDETRAAFTERFSRRFMRTFAGSFVQAERLHRQGVMEAKMARAVLAAAAYRADKGKWPEKLSDLAPAYLKEIPRDIYSEGGKEEVGFNVSDEGVMVSSMGRKNAKGERKAVEVGMH